MYNLHVNNQNNREFIERFQRLRTLYDLKKTVQRANTHTEINGIKYIIIFIHTIVKHTHTHTRFNDTRDTLGGFLTLFYNECAMSSGGN